MKKILYSILLLPVTSLFAQTAPDFTAIDCDGTSHNLYSELNTGKVIVLNWVMPCSMCIGGSAGAYNTVQGYASSNPGVVLHYLLDDNGGTACSTLQSWAVTNSIG